MQRPIVAAAFALCLAAGLAQPGLAQPPAGPPPDALTDPALKGPEVIAFLGVKPGDQVADIMSGRFLHALSRAAGPTGKLYAFEAAEVTGRHPEILAMVKAASADPAYANVTLIAQPIDALTLPSGLDEVFIRENYHDLHDKFMGPADVAAFDRKVFAALKPGGVFVVLDHAAAPGSGVSATETLHRIDPAAVKAEVEAAGFVLDGESTILANPADDHTLKIFNPAIRGRTDEFLLRFRKPR